MRSYPSSRQVFADLGDKVLDAITRSVAAAKSDLAQYRVEHPSWVAQHSERGLAAWIHDRVWYHFSVLVDGIDDITLVDKEPTREVGVGVTYRLRIKRHHGDGEVSTFPTQGALDFMSQEPQLVIEGLDEVRLIAGYEWTRDSREMGGALLSLRDGKDNVIWCEPVQPPDGGEAHGPVSRPEAPSPSRPAIDASRVRPDTQEGDVPG